MRTACLPGLGLTLLAALGGALGACEVKEKEKAVPASAEPVTETAPAPETTPQPPAPAPALPVSATEAERALASAFIEKFLAAIEANDSNAWPDLHTKTRREALVANDAVEKSFEAWHKGTRTVVTRIREADFTLQRSGEQFTLRFVGVRVPTDPDTEYSMSVAIEDGEMRISEK